MRAAAAGLLGRRHPRPDSSRALQRARPRRQHRGLEARHALGCHAGYPGGLVVQRHHAFEPLRPVLDGRSSCGSCLPLSAPPTARLDHHGRRRAHWTGDGADGRLAGIQRHRRITFRGTVCVPQVQPDRCRLEEQHPSGRAGHRPAFFRNGIRRRGPGAGTESNLDDVPGRPRRRPARRAARRGRGGPSHKHSESPLLSTTCS